MLPPWVANTKTTGEGDPVGDKSLSVVDTQPRPFMMEGVKAGALTSPSQYMWAHCQLCGCVWHYDFVLPASVSVVAECVGIQCCPSCGGDVNNQRLCSEEARKAALADL